MMTLWQYLGGSPLSRIEVEDHEVQSLDFMPDGTVLIVYVEGDVDIFMPFVVVG